MYVYRVCRTSTLLIQAQHSVPEPQPALPNNPVPNWWPSDGDIGGGPYEHIPENNQGHDPGAQTNATSTLQSVPPAHLSEKPEQTPGEA